MSVIALPSRLTFNINRAAGLFDNAATDTQPQTGSFALRLGGKEWFPAFLEIFRRDAGRLAADG